jgi:nucleotide-binding universal stress UspA family protein
VVHSNSRQSVYMIAKAFLEPSNRGAVYQERILLPIDTRKCPLEILSFVNGLAAQCDVSVTLLSVITLNILAPEARLYDELAAEARCYLECLAREYLPAAASTTIRIRFGNFADEIIAQARAEIVDLIVLPKNNSSFFARVRSIWQREPHFAFSPLVKKVVGKVNCGVVVVSPKTHLDCEMIWSRPRQSIEHEQRLAHVMHSFRPAEKASPQAEGLAQTFLGQKYVRAAADARDAPPHNRPMARGLFRFRLS